MTDESTAILDDDDEATEAVADQSTPQADEGPRCTNCGAPDERSAWCRYCGFVPRYGTFVEPDPPEVVVEASEQKAWWKNIPSWAWIVGGAVLGVVVLSASARLVTEPLSTPRMCWALAELGIGLVVLISAHAAAYMLAVMENPQLGVFDAFVKPFAIWGPTCHAMPSTLRRILCGACGLTAMLCGPLVVGSIPYDAIWEYGPRAQAKQNLVQAITEQAAKAKGTATNLNDAIKGFAGEGGEGVDTPAKAAAAPKLRVAECVVIGYRPRGDQDFDELLLASVVDNQLRVVGTVSAGITPEMRPEINQRLRSIHTDRPLVTNRVTGMQWVEARVACKVRFRDWTPARWLEEPEFDELMTEIAPE